MIWWMSCSSQSPHLHTSSPPATWTRLHALKQHPTPWIQPRLHSYFNICTHNTHRHDKCVHRCHDWTCEQMFYSCFTYFTATECRPDQSSVFALVRFDSAGNSAATTLRPEPSKVINTGFSNQWLWLSLVFQINLSAFILSDMPFVSLVTPDERKSNLKTYSDWNGAR